MCADTAAVMNHMIWSEKAAEEELVHEYWRYENEVEEPQRPTSSQDG
jgi:hypothetical protein